MTTPVAYRGRKSQPPDRQRRRRTAPTGRPRYAPGSSRRPPRRFTPPKRARRLVIVLITLVTRAGSIRVAKHVSERAGLVIGLGRHLPREIEVVTHLGDDVGSDGPTL